MITRHLSPEVLEYILANVHSIEQLEILLFLRSAAGQTRSIEEINDSIRSTQDSIRERIALLVTQGLVTRDADDANRYRYQPDTALLAATIENVLDAYLNQRAEVTEMIYNKPAGNIIGFANAFRLSRKKDE